MNVLNEVLAATKALKELKGGDMDPLMAAIDIVKFQVQVNLMERDFRREREQGPKMTSEQYAASQRQKS